MFECPCRFFSLNAVRAIRTFLILFLFLAGNALRADSSASLKPEQIAPGVWRIRIGTPEKTGVPSACRSFTADVSGLGRLPAAGKCPLDLSKIQILATASGLRLELPYEKDEIIYGLGLQGDTFQQQGKLRELRNNCAVLNGLGLGHASFPYYVDSKGYAVLFDTARFVEMRIGTNVRKSHALETVKASSDVATATNDVTAVAEDAAASDTMGDKPFLVTIPVAQGVDIYVFAGPSMLNAVQRYNLYSGGGALPPLWGLGVKFRMNSLANQQDVLTLAKHFRDSRLPINVIGLEPGWHSKSYACSFDWNTERFNREALLAEFAKMNYRLSLWEHPYIAPVSPYYKSFYEKSGDFAVFGGLVPDLADPAASALYSQIHANLIAKGASSFKIDANDNIFLDGDRVWPFPNSTEFPSGLEGERMHQLFGVLTQQAVLKPFTDAHLRTFGETRCSGPFAAPYPFTLFSDMYKDADYFRMIVNGGFCGLLWQPEVRRGNGFDDFYARIQMAVISPATTFNNYMMPFPAWMQNDPKKNKQRELYSAGVLAPKEDILRSLLEQRMSLVPYLYAAYQRYQAEGLPPFRALALDYPDDAACADIDDEMMIGDSLLGYVFLDKAAPREVYLPKGNWYDYNTGKKYAGGTTVPVKFAAAQLPLFVKEGAILPLAKPVDHIDRDTVFDLTCRIYGDAPAPAVLCEDDGETLDYRKGLQNRVTLAWDKATGGKVSREGQFPGKRYTITAWTPVIESTPNP